MEELKMHAKNESDVPSITTSSSHVSPKCSVYYVQSPSCDSHEDVDKSCSYTQTTPHYHHLCSATESASHQSSPSLGRLTGNRRWMVRGNRRGGGKGFRGCNVIDEEGGCDDDDDDTRFTLTCRCFLAFITLAAMFAMFCLIIWGASRPYKVQITIKRLKLHNFYNNQGVDPSGVPTTLITVNCSVSMFIYNPATFFGIHVSANPVNLIYSELPVATGQLEEYYQPRKSNRVMIVNLEGQRVLLYGAGEGFNGLDDNGEVPMKLDFELHSRGHLVGKLVKTKHRVHISCSLDISSRRTEDIIFKNGSCEYRIDINLCNMGPIPTFSLGLSQEKQQTIQMQHEQKEDIPVPIKSTEKGCVQVKSKIEKVYTIVSQAKLDASKYGLKNL